MKITLHAHPLAAVAPQVFEAERLAEWLLCHYGPVPTVNLQIFRGEPCAANDISRDVDAIMASDAPEYVVLQSPGGLDPFTVSIIMIVLNVAVQLLAPKPSPLPNVQQNRTQQSPNNALASRENQVRMLQRVEDIYGTVRSIPSLMMPTYNKYVAHEKYEYGYYCAGRGYYTLSDIRDGDTLISDINGAAASVYDPFTSPNGGTPVLQIGDAIIDNVITAARAIEVDGITLQAPNQVQLPASAVYDFAYGGMITQTAKTPNFDAVVTIGDDITITMSPTVVTSAAGQITANAGAKTFADDLAVGLFSAVAPGETITTAGFTTPGNNGTWVVTVRTDYLLTVSVAPTTETSLASTVSVTKDYSGTYPVTSVGDGFIVVGVSLLGTTPGITAGVQIDGVSEFTDWVTLPDAARTEVWCNVTAPNGMFKDDGGKSVATVAFAFEIEQLNAITLAPTGIVETVTGSLSGSVTDERADTIEHATAWTGPARVRARRTTNYDYAFAGTVIDEVKWADLYSITPVAATEFGNKTTIHTITRATARATAVKTRQLNCTASRLLPTYDGSTLSGAFDATGLHTSGTITATSKLVDIISAVALDPKIGRRDLATEVDMAQIWGVQQQLDAWGADYGQFNYTFDSDNTSFEETLMAIANAGFCTAYRQNGKIRLAFDRAQTTSSALFTHRNKKPNAETMTRKFASDAEFDGVEFVYMDPDSQQNETITLPLDGSYTKLKKFEIPGIRNYTQAWRRACREYRKLTTQRLSLETVTTLDGRSLLPNTRIDVADNTRFKTYDGEVVGQSGMTLTLSRDVAFTPALPHSIVLMRRDGSLQSIACTAGPSANQVVLASLPSEAITTVHGADGIRTIFSFAADSAREAMAWLVQEIDISDGQYCTVRAINYSASYYADDTTTVPPKASVIG